MLLAAHSNLPFVVVLWALARTCYWLLTSVGFGVWVQAIEKLRSTLGDRLGDLSDNDSDDDDD